MKNGWQIANDCVNSVFRNGSNILKPAATKTALTSGTYLYNDIRYNKVVPLGLKNYLSAPGSAWGYVMTLPSIGCAIYSFMASDPIGWAEMRGFELI